MKQLIQIKVLVSLMFSCTQSTKVFLRNEQASFNLLNKLKRLNSKGILFGNQDDLAYEIGCKYAVSNKLISDVKKATGPFPAIVGWDINHIGDSLNFDKIAFENIKKLII